MDKSNQTDKSKNGIGNDPAPLTSFDITRRECVSVLGATAVGAGLSMVINDVAVPCQAASLGETLPVEIRINGGRHNLAIDPRVTLLDLLREHLGLIGTRKGCDHGQCGVCTVLVNGRRINSCLTLALSHDGDEVTTIEGLESGGNLHPIQSAFIENDAFQCGYCTPGQICSAVAMLSEAQRGDASYVSRDLAHPGPIELTDDEIRERMSGNICRCGAYPGIVATLRAAGRTSAQTPGIRERSQ
ncbi:MAG TPA: 2Fe-2S iron-sulfur cluster-binding protein [Bryobacteraceae bacterium]|jgi:xanthine dehydrogenase YagT iron-sulfur-binding subunit|nr:2Fe-2S iron-sulfur cluster-binding protein [Bryobacteraceae bacterium]